MLKRLARKYAPLELQNLRLTLAQPPVITLNPDDGVCELSFQLALSNTTTYTVECLCCDLRLEVGPKSYAELQRVLMCELKPGGAAQHVVKVPLTETQINLALMLFGDQEMKSGRIDYSLMISSPFGRETIHRREEVNVRCYQAED